MKIRCLADRAMPVSIRCLLALRLFWAAAAFSADEQAEEEYPYIYLLRQRHVTLKANGEKVVRLHRRIKVLKPAAVESLGEVRMPYNSYRAKAKFVRGRTILPDGRELEVDRKAIRQGQSAGMTDYLMYEDVAELSFSMPAVRVGAILDYEIELRHHRPTLKGQSWDSFRVEANVPVQEARYLLEAPSKLPLRICPRRTDAKPTEKKGFRSITREWVFKDVPRFHFEPGMPAVYDSQIAIHVTTLQSWRVIQDWYAKLAEDAFTADDAIRAKVAELTAGATTEQAKIRALYLFMQKDIRYVGIELGRSAYQPHPAVDCFRNRYGDCKDQAVLLITMLRQIGIEAHLALVRAGDGTVDRELPDVGQFNHVIVYVPRSDGPLWLDATVKYMDEASHPHHLDNAQALIADAPEGTEFITIVPPRPDRSCQRTIYEVDVQAEGSCQIKEILEYVGRNGAQSRVGYENLSPKRRRKMVEAYVKGKGAVLVSYGNSDPHDLSGPFREWIVYDARSFLADTADGSSFNLSAGTLSWAVSLPQVRRRPGQPRAVRERPWSTGGTFSEELVCLLRLPPGIRPNPPPAPYDVQLAQGHIRLSATVTGNTVAAKACVERTPCIIPAKQYEVHKVRTDRAIGRASLTLTFTDEVGKLATAHRRRQARELATKLAAQHPDNPETHIALAGICHDSGRLVQARKEYREAIRLAPERLSTYTLLAWTYAGYNGYFGQGFKRDKVLAIAREAVEKARDRRGAQFFLAECLERDKNSVVRGKERDDYSEAIAVYQRMLAERPEDLTPLNRIAECHYALREYAKAEACFNRILRKEPNNASAKAGQWICAACLGRTDEAISAIQTAHDTKEARAGELARVSGQLMQQRKYGAMLEFIDSRLAIVQQRNQAMTGFRELIAKVAEAKLIDTKTYFDLSTPEHALSTLFSALLQQDRERLAKALSPRMGLLGTAIDDLLEAGGLLASTVRTDATLDLLRSVWSYQRTPLPGGLVRLDASIPRELASSLGGKRESRFAMLCEKDEKGAWRACGFGRPELAPDTLAQLAFSFRQDGKLEVAKHYADLVRQRFLRQRTLAAEPNLFTELADLAYPDDDAFVKAMVSASLPRWSGDPGTDDPASLRLARELATRMPDAIPVQRLLANHLHATEHYGQALAVREELARRQPENKQLIVEKLTTLRRLYRYRDAIAAADQLAKLMPSADLAKGIKLDVLVQAGEAEQGLKLLKELEPRWKPELTRRMKIRLSAAKGDQARLLVLASETLKDEKATAFQRVSLIGSLRHAGLHERALELAEISCAKDASKLAIGELCEQLLYTGELEEARDAFDRLADAGDYKGLSAHYLACLGVALGRFDAAERIFAETLRKLDIDSKIYGELFIGVCRIMRGETKAGKEAIARANAWQYDEIWPKPVLQYFAGKATLKDMIAAAKLAETPTQRDQFLCEAYFYAAINAHMAGDKTKYKLFLRQAADMRSYLTMECAMAHGLLGIKAPPDGK